MHTTSISFPPVSEDAAVVTGGLLDVEAGAAELALVGQLFTQHLNKLMQPEERTAIASYLVAHRQPLTTVTSHHLTLDPSCHR